MTVAGAKQLIIYDLDGTLVDTGEDITNAANHMLERMAEPAMSRDAVSELVGRGLHDLVRRCLKTEDPVRVEQGLRWFYGHYQAHLFDHSRLYAGAMDVLEYFRFRRQAIVTNKPHPFARRLMEGLGVSGYFAEIIEGDSTYPKKPDPTSLHALMRRWQVAPHDVLLIGDSPIDVETGKNAGVATVMLTHGFADPSELKAANPDALVPGFDALLAMVKQRGW